MLTVRSLLCIAQQGPHVLVFQVYRLLSLTLQWLCLRRLRRRPPVRWFQPPLRRRCQLHSLSLRRSLQLSSALPSHLYASSLLASTIFPARVASLSLAPAFTSNGRSSSTSTRTNVKFSVGGNFPHTPSVQAPSMGPYVGSSSNLPPVSQWPATTPGFQPHSASFPPGQTQQVICYLLLFPSNYPVAGPVAFFRGRLPPVMCSLAPRRFQLLISPLLLCVRASLQWKTTPNPSLRVLRSLPTSSSFGRQNGAKQ